MFHVTEETIQQALRDKVITKREAQELLASLTMPKPKKIERRKKR